jgi:hypothetical protein
VDLDPGVSCRPNDVVAAGNAMITVDGLIVATVDNEVRLIGPVGGQPVAHVTAPAKIEPWSLSISPDGRVVLVGDNQGGGHIRHIPPA